MELCRDALAFIFQVPALANESQVISRLTVRQTNSTRRDRTRKQEQCINVPPGEESEHNAGSTPTVNST